VSGEIVSQKVLIDIICHD